MLYDCDQLKVLKLDHNELIEVQNNAFAMCKWLTELDLSHNHLRILHKGIFAKQVPSSKFVVVFKHYDTSITIRILKTTENHI